MRQIRKNVFETNSSSTHSICICTEKQFEDWKNGKYLYNEYDEELVPLCEPTAEDWAEAEKEYKNIKTPYYKNWEDLTDEMKESFVRASEFFTTKRNLHNFGLVEFSNWGNNLETYEEHFTTPSGDNMVAFGEYGYDG